MKVFVDTEGWMALVLADHPRHEVVAAEMRRLSDEHARLVTGNYILDETATALREQAGLVVALRFLVQLDAAEAAGRIQLLWVDARVHQDAWRLLQANRELALSFTDATTAVLARSQRVDSVLTLDPLFDRLGFAVIPGGAMAVS